MTAARTGPKPNRAARFREATRGADTSALFSYVLALADKGWQKALADDRHLRNGLNVAFGKVTCKPVADALGYKYVAPEALI